MVSLLLALGKFDLVLATLCWSSKGFTILMASADFVGSIVSFCLALWFFNLWINSDFVPLVDNPWHLHSAFNLCRIAVIKQALIEDPKRVSKVWKGQGI